MRGYIVRKMMSKINFRVLNTIKKLKTFEFGEMSLKNNELEHRPCQVIVQDNVKMKYIGQWIIGTNIRQGRGTLIWQDGSCFEGHFKNNKAKGKGRMIHANGDVYEGEFQENKANGDGTYTQYNGTVYKGQFVNDRQEGYGKENYNDGAYYEGTFLDGMKHGEGTFMNVNGQKY